VETQAQVASMTSPARRLNHETPRCSQPGACRPPAKTRTRTLSHRGPLSAVNMPATKKQSERTAESSITGANASARSATSSR
jgi:hypothetical protein